MTVLSVACGSCAGNAGQTNSSKDMKRVAEGSNRFALQLYQKLQSEGGNLFLSPYSISTALAMVYAGAQGSTREQMARVLSLAIPAEATQAPGGRESSAATPPAGKTMTQEQVAQAFGKIIKDLNARGAGDKYELRVANALWGQRDYKFLPEFVTLVEREYGGKLQQVDFVKAAEQARQTINTWVEKQTNGKIKDLISPGVLDAMTRLVLTNAIYFKGNWINPFEKDQTRDEPFTLTDVTTVQVPMMNHQARFGYAETDALQALEMPYTGEGLTMVVLLPKKTDGIAELGKELTADNLVRWLGQIRQREVIVSVPKFKMTSKFSLGRVLQSMGMTDAFSDRADFSGMTGNRELFLSAVIHQAYVDVNEEGTEAAAATGAVMSVTSVGPGQTPVFRADHPFLFLIRDKKTDSILFLGRVMNPQT
jgi:serpin B